MDQGGMDQGGRKKQATMSRVTFGIPIASFIECEDTTVPHAAAPCNPVGKCDKPTEKFAESNSQTEYDKFVEKNYNIDINILVSQRQEVLEIAKRLPDDIASKETEIETLNERNGAIDEIVNFVNQKLQQDDTLLPQLSTSLTRSLSETKRKLITLHQELENLKKLQITLHQKLGIGENKLSCNICLEHQQEFVVAQCGHTCCTGCSTRIPNCYVCKEPANWRRLFI